MSEAHSGNKYKKILCFDGGGINGLFTIRLLQRILAERPYFMNNISMFSGTSAGAINALILAQYPKDPVHGLERCEKLWKEPDLFTMNPWELPLTMLGLAPLLSAQNFRRVLSNYIPATLTLSKLPTEVLVTAFDLQSERTGAWEPTFFSPDLTPDDYALDVAQRACALPVLTAVHQGYIDGGVFNPSPALSALAIEMLDDICQKGWGYICNMVDEEIKKTHLEGDTEETKRARLLMDGYFEVLNEVRRIRDEPSARVNYGTLVSAVYNTIKFISHTLSTQERLDILKDVYPKDGGILVLSLGTGKPRNDLITLPRDRPTPWGLLQWMVPGPWNSFSNMLSLMLDSMEDIINMNIAMLQGIIPLLKGYHRLNPTIMYPPIPATVACTVPWLRGFVLNQIDADVRKLTTQYAIRDALQWLDTTAWYVEDVHSVFSRPQGCDSAD